ncbi:MAG: hypothetical protein WCF18_15960 [Chthoniobacteraceae bacterium]
MNPPPNTDTERRLPSGFAWQLVALVLVIVGCKLWLVASFSSPLPFLDQWKGEGAEVLRPWMKGELRITDLVAPFNEHRIVPSRVLLLGLFEGNARQWDSQVEMIAGALLHAACAVVLGAVLVRQLGRRFTVPVLGALLVLFCLPFDWQNTLWGFQTSFYFLILFSVIACWGLGGSAAGSKSWWMGAVAGLLACLSLGSGGLAGLAIAGWVGLKMIVHSGTRRASGSWATLGVSLALGALGSALYTPPKIASIGALQARTPGSFLWGFAIHLGWPNSTSPFFALLAYAPFVVLVCLRLRAARRNRAGEFSIEDFLFPLGFWVLLQAAAIAYSRNHPVASVISRYMDLLALGALVNFCCLLRLFQLSSASPPSIWARRALVPGAAVWTAVALAGLVPLLQRNFRLDLPSLQKIHRVQIAAVRQFVTNGRGDDLGGKPVFGLPPADLDILADLLRDPVAQNILPTGIGIRRISAAPGPLTTAARMLTDGWGLLLGAGVLTFVLSALSDWLASRRNLPKTPSRADIGRIAVPDSSAKNAA